MLNYDLITKVKKIDSIHKRIGIVLIFGFFLGLSPLLSQSSEKSIKQHDQELKAVILSEHLKKSKRKQLKPDLSPEQQRKIVDKSRFVEGKEIRLVGLRERGNPHIQQGLRIEQIQEDRQRMKVDSSTRRKRMIAMVEKGKIPPEEFSYNSKRLPPGRTHSIEKNLEVKEDKAVSQTQYSFLVTLMAAVLLILAISFGKYFVRLGED